MKKRLLFVVNDPVFFVSHRLPLAIGAQCSGYEVHIATMPGPVVDEIERHGFFHHALPLSRSGKNPLAELRAIASIYQLFRALQPDLVHLVTIKPVLYGGIAARLVGVRGVVAAVSGLGFVFLASGLKATLMRFPIKLLYRFALGKQNLRVIFQNPDDRDVLLNMGALDAGKVEMIRGSGVDLAHYPALPEPEGLPVICLAARLLRDKGVREFVEAARLLRQRGVRATFRLIGDADPGNPATVTADELKGWSQEAVVELLGYRKDIAKLFAAAHVVVLPSYREGLPKVLVEAAACGRAVVTTDVPGCRDAIEPDVTGLLVPARDSVALADAIQRLVDDSTLRRSFGQAGRALAEREFAIEKIVQAHLDIYKKLEVGV
ncbi:glycosyltransferase family 4 protein [Pseudomonas sp. 2FE]|uniref:glycosyltransferase family 4 protein n=1 Tax=Pseudomonas sp. 2FE TaxID=2502190 RepID=UPI0010F459E3|nr:glycosyltransferase family 4 protein [Pseudomonas sp. 2FE]